MKTGQMKLMNKNIKFLDKSVNHKIENVRKVVNTGKQDVPITSVNKGGNCLFRACRVRSIGVRDKGVRVRVYCFCVCGIIIRNPFHFVITILRHLCIKSPKTANQKNSS